MSSARKSPLAGVRTRADVAKLLDISDRKLNYLLYVRPESDRYTAFTIRKRRGGKRTILAPRDDLKLIQRRLAAILEAAYPPRLVAHGFVKARGITSNADVHVRSRFVLNVDLKDFFPSINFGRVRGLLMSEPISAGKEAATVLAQICCHRGCLPQGAPTSPVLSNMVCHRLDRQLQQLAKQYHCRYSRYVDDLTFSRKQGAFPPELARFDEDKKTVLGQEFRSTIEKNGFSVNPDKVWLFRNTHRQTVTGLVVNSKRNVHRGFIRQIEAMIHAWKTFGLKKAQKEYHERWWKPKLAVNIAPDFPQVVRGKLEFVKMVRGIGDRVYRRLQSEYLEVDSGYFDVIVKENRQMSFRDVFISHASEDKTAVAKPLADLLLAAGLSVWYDEYEIRLGDDILEKVDDGLANSQFGILILSPNFFAAKKTWTKKEYSGLVAGEDTDKSKRILPVWHKLTRAQLATLSPTIANRKALLTNDNTINEIAAQIAERVRQGN